MLIFSSAERVERSKQKRGLLLAFLKDETWSHVEVLRAVLDIKSPGMAYKTLTQMEREQLVRRHTFRMIGHTPVTLWGLTPHGLGMSWGILDKPDSRSHFVPSRVTLARIPHQINLQKIRLIAEKKGWVEWMRGERLGFKPKSRPDAVVLRPDGIRLAVELELHIKTKACYQAVIRGHLLQIKEGAWDGVVYFSDHVDRLKRVFDSIDYVVLHGKRLAIEDNHRTRFKFVALDGWLAEWSI